MDKTRKPKSHEDAFGSNYAYSLTMDVTKKLCQDVINLINQRTGMLIDQMPDKTATANLAFTIPIAVITNCIVNHVTIFLKHTDLGDKSTPELICLMLRHMFLNESTGMLATEAVKLALQDLEKLNGKS